MMYRANMFRTYYGTIHAKMTSSLLQNKKYKRSVFIDAECMLYSKLVNRNILPCHKTDKKQEVASDPGLASWEFTVLYQSLGMY